jgi:hypothetical protein
MDSLSKLIFKQIDKKLKSVKDFLMDMYSRLTKSADLFRSAMNELGTRTAVANKRGVQLEANDHQYARAVYRKIYEYRQEILAYLTEFRVMV